MIIFTLDVLALPGKGIGQRQPSPEGRRLWKAFASTTATMVLAAPMGDPLGHLSHWLKAEGYAPDLTHEYLEAGPGSGYEAAATLQAVHRRVDFLVTTDPTSVRMALDAGMAAVLAVFPTFMRPDWRVRERSSWADLTDRLEVERMKRLEAADRDDDDE